MHNKWCRITCAFVITIAGTIYSMIEETNHSSPPIRIKTTISRLFCEVKTMKEVDNTIKEVIEANKRQLGFLIPILEQVDNDLTEDPELKNFTEAKAMWYKIFAFLRRFPPIITMPPSSYSKDKTQNIDKKDDKKTSKEKNVPLKSILKKDGYGKTQFSEIFGEVKRVQFKKKVTVHEIPRKKNTIFIKYTAWDIS